MRSAAGSTGGGRRALEFKEYETGQLFYRRRCPVRTFTSASAKEKHKISAKLQARFDGPYKVTGRVNAVVYWADINGEETRVHAMNMKPQNALTTQTTLQRQDKEAEKEEKGGGARAPRARGFTDIEDID
jgi:hypothetical protein